MSQSESSVQGVDPQKLHLGSARAGSGQFSEGDPVQLTPKRLLRHMMALGSSGSGKTVLSKVLVEEMTRLGLPAICIDPQGDLCSLALALSAGEADELAARGVSPELAAAFREQVEVVVFTPAARCGVPLCADPMHIDLEGLSERERIESISNIASMITALIGFDLGSDDGEGVRAAFDSHLSDRAEAGDYPKSLAEFARQVSSLDEDERAPLERFVSATKLERALRKLARLDVGARRLLFHEGIPLNIDLLLGRGERSGATPGKTRLSVVYINTLSSAEDKEFIIATLAEQLYAWMLQNPSVDPQALFYIDEVAPFIPPVKAPACKPALSLIFKQARKYGVCCLMATQNPGDVDYKAMAQFGTWAIGRLTTRQDQRKIQPTVNALDPDRADEIMGELPAQQAGEFMLISPDEFDETVRLKTRWLYSRHETLDERRIQKLCDERWRERFTPFEVSAKESSKTSSKTGSKTDQDERELLSSEVALKSMGDDSRSESQPEPQAEPKAEPTFEDHVIELMQSGEAYSATTLSQTLDVSRNRAAKALKAREAAGELACFAQGRSQLYYLLESGARPDLGLSRETAALVPKLSKAEIEERAESNRSKSYFLGMIGREETLTSREMVYRVLYQVIFREEVEKSGISSFFSSQPELIEDSIYLEPETLKILVYKPSQPITLEDQPAELASQIPDFDGVSDETQLAPGSVKFDEAAWARRVSTDALKSSVTRRFPKLTILEVRPILMPLLELRYKESSGHQVRVIHVDGLTGQPVTI